MCSLLTLRCAGLLDRVYLDYQKYHKTPAQILIRWSLQRGFIVIPKGTGSHIDENANVYDFSLSNDDLHFLDTLETGQGVTWNRTWSSIILDSGICCGWRKGGSLALDAGGDC